MNARHAAALALVGVSDDTADQPTSLRATIYCARPDDSGSDYCTIELG
jgi:hypothetical protein